MRSKIRLTEKVTNTSRRLGSDTTYYPVMVDTGYAVRPALFTLAQIDVALARAAANPEDMPKPRRWWEFWK